MKSKGLYKFYFNRGTKYFNDDTFFQFAVTKGTDEATLRHETAHLQQYREWGAY